jgi:hypothetical protein
MSPIDKLKSDLANIDRLKAFACPPVSPTPPASEHLDSNVVSLDTARARRKATREKVL